jgi:SlyX protein
MSDHALEERIAHLEKTVDELSTMLATRGAEIDLLTARVERLLVRERQREAEGTGGVILGDERPPHY